MDAVVRALQKAVEHPQFVEQPQGRGMNRVAAKIAEEILMLLEHDRRHAGACEQKPGEQARRTAADDAQVRRMFRSWICPFFRHRR
jgi:hypothetical protein